MDPGAPAAHPMPGPSGKQLVSVVCPTSEKRTLAADSPQGSSSVQLQGSSYGPRVWALTFFKGIRSMGPCFVVPCYGVRMVLEGFRFKCSCCGGTQDLLRISPVRANRSRPPSPNKSSVGIIGLKSGCTRTLAEVPFRSARLGAKVSYRRSVRGSPSTGGCMRFGKDKHSTGLPMKEVHVKINRYTPPKERGGGVRL